MKRRSCPCCPRLFWPNSPRQTYCSGKCRTRGYRTRVQAEMKAYLAGQIVYGQPKETTR